MHFSELTLGDGFKFQPGKIANLLSASNALQLTDLEGILQAICTFILLTVKAKRNIGLVGASVIPSEKLAEDLQKAVDNPLHSDLVVECQDGVKIRVHKVPNIKLVSIIHIVHAQYPF